jgi:hypothetical protein
MHFSLSLSRVIKNRLNIPQEFFFILNFREPMWMFSSVQIQGTSVRLIYAVSMAERSKQNGRPGNAVAWQIYLTIFTHGHGEQENFVEQPDLL